mmetsp:Transcript_733/g.1300  ORF Transcript_733/g.1300 Transcript_733/m.1300 type:complete len:251 (-) Transcript_733:589-1341(-)
MPGFLNDVSQPYATCLSRVKLAEKPRDVSLHGRQPTRRSKRLHALHEVVPGDEALSFYVENAPGQLDGLELVEEKLHEFCNQGLLFPQSANESFSGSRLRGAFIPSSNHLLHLAVDPMLFEDILIRPRPYLCRLRGKELPTFWRCGFVFVCILSLLESFHHFRPRDALVLIIVEEEEEGLSSQVAHWIGALSQHLHKDIFGDVDGEVFASCKSLPEFLFVFEDLIKPGAEFQDRQEPLLNVVPAPCTTHR